MPCLNVSKHRKIAAGILGMLMLFVMLFSAFYIVAEADHDCAGNDCPICVCIQQCENTLHQLSNGTALQAAVIIPVLFLLVSAVFSAYAFLQETPVSRKVRLNN